MSYYLDGRPYLFISLWVFFIFISLWVFFIFISLWVFFIFIWLIIVLFIFVREIFFWGLFTSRGSLGPGRAVVAFGSGESLGLEDNGTRGHCMSFHRGR